MARVEDMSTGETSALAAVGRGRGYPTKYRAGYCDDVIEWGRAGKSRTWMAATIGVHRDTLYEWEAVHPEFSDALKRAKDLEQLWWEDKGQENIEADRFQSAMWSRSMAARFPDDWRETTRNETGGINGKPIETTTRIEWVVVKPTPIPPKE